MIILGIIFLLVLNGISNDIEKIRKAIEARNKQDGIPVQP